MKFAPLTSSFMLISILGFIISVFYVFPKSSDWGFTFALMFIVFFLASMVSMTYGESIARLHPKINRTQPVNRATKKQTTIKKSKKVVKTTKKSIRKATKKSAKKIVKKKSPKKSKKRVKKSTKKPNKKKIIKKTNKKTTRKRK